MPVNQEKVGELLRRVHSYSGDIGTVAAVVAAVVGVGVLWLMMQYRKEDVADRARERERKAANVRAALRGAFESIARHIPNPGPQTSYVALRGAQMEPLKDIERCLDQIDVLPDEVQDAVREAYHSLWKIGSPYTLVTPPPEDMLKAKETVANVLLLL